MNSSTFIPGPPDLNNAQPPDQKLSEMATYPEPYQEMYPGLFGGTIGFNEATFGMNNSYQYNAGPVFAQGNGYNGYTDQAHGLPTSYMDNPYDAGPSGFGGHKRTFGVDISREVNEAPIKSDNDPEQEEDLDGLQIRDSNDFLRQVGKRVREQRIEKTRWAADYGNPIDFPTDASEQRAYVKRLMAAMKSTANVLDKPCKNGKPAQAAQRLERGYYPDEEIEMVCWQILLGLKDSQMGVILVAEHHANKFEQYDSFKSRFQAVIQTLRQSKAACKQLLDPSFVDRLCDAPDSELAMKVNNKKVNAERDTQNEIGRKVLTGKLQPNQVADLQLEDAEAERTPSGRKKRTPHVGRSAPRGLLATVTPKSKPNSTKSTPSSRKSKSGSKRKALSTPKKKIKQESDSDEEEDYEEEEGDDEEDAVVTPPSPRYSSKRKLKPVNYAENDFQDPEDDEYAPSPYTPSKKPRTKNGQQTRGHLAWGGNLAPPPMPFPASAPIVPEPLLLPSRTNGGAPTRAPGFDHPTYDPDHDKKPMAEERKEVYDSYRDVVSGLLGIKPEDGKKYTLNDLRFYARAYNAGYAGIVFYTKELEADRLHLVDHRVFEENNNMIMTEHFANVIPRFRYLARLRGDLTQDNQVVLHGPSGNVFNTFGEEVDDRALGARHNPFGLQEYLYGEQPYGFDYVLNTMENGAEVPPAATGN